tara:strand:+ start:8334 stop:8978 length:645 start_codon:yes stop_codon:yes gene_type:complete
MAFDSLSAISSRIWEELSGGWIFDDERLNIKLIQDKVHVARSKLIGEYLRKKMYVNTSFYQECCVDVVCELSCAEAPKNTKEYVVKLPTLIGAANHKGVKFLGTVDREISFEQRDSFEDFTYDIPFSGTPSPYFVLVDNNKAILRNLPTPYPKKLLFIGLFANPLSCDECDVNSSYPVPGGEFISDIETLVKSDLAGFLLQRKVDKIHNANPDN